MHFLGKYPDAMTLAFKHHDEKIENFQDEEGSIMFKWDSIKWYEGYKDIDAFTEFMDHMDSDYEEEENRRHGDEHYRFVRIGEDSSDIEERGCAFYVYPTASIDY